MASLTIGKTYTFDYVGGRIYDPELCTTKGIYVGDYLAWNIFYVKLPSEINDITGYLIYTRPRLVTEGPETLAKDKAVAERVARYITTFAFANQRPNAMAARLDPTVYISQSKIDSFLAAADATPVNADQLAATQEVS